MVDFNESHAETNVTVGHRIKTGHKYHMTEHTLL